MTSNLTNLPVDEIRALADERGRYEGWITALESRRGQTPPHVYDRVKQDYDGRLQRVLDRLAEHLPALRDGEATLSRRDDELARSLADRQDELAEVELRTLVGEYEADEGERLRAAKQEEVRSLEAERTDVDGELAAVRELVVRASPPGAAAGVTASAPAATMRTDEGTTLPDTNADAYRGTASAGHHFAPPAPERLGVADDAGLGAPTDAAAPLDADGAAAGAGDDADLLGAGALGGAAGADRGADRGGDRPAEREMAPLPFAAAGMPAPEKTLRCQDCGAMNYPTEWYCERCGGELAAL